MDPRRELRLRKRKREVFLQKILLAAGTALVLIIIFGRIFSPKDTYSKAFTPQARQQKTIVIDAGHGGKDSGCVLKSEEINEKDINLSIALKLKSILEARGDTVILTRDSDEFTGLEARAQIGSRKEVDLFISIHQNILENDTSTSGIETWFHSGSNRYNELLAACIQEQTAAHAGAKDLGIKESMDLVVLKNTSNPSCLIETGFLSNEEEKDKLLTNSYQIKIATGIANGIEKFLEQM